MAIAVLKPEPSSPRQSLKHKLSISGLLRDSTSTGGKRRKKTTSLVNEDRDFENGTNTVLGSLNRHLLADLITQRTKKFAKDLSLIDTEKKRVPVHAIHDTGSWQRPRILENLPEFIEVYSSRFGQSKNLASSSEEKGSPHTIVVTAASLRAADITRYAYRKMQRSLSTDKLERIVVDMSHIDQKKRGILDMKETFEPLVQLLTRKDLERHSTTEAGRVDLLFF
ncbi:hypothetical protein MMC26_007548 [Xylographa opegraphella]|nr:hypothetical protein [Xylographa opegraphella]